MTKILTKNFWSVFFLVVVIVILFFVSHQDTLARLAWQKYHLPQLAILLDRKDANLAMQIGNYYFNGGVYDLDKAITYFKKSLLINPKTLLAHYQIARIFFLRGDYSNALIEVNAEMELHPEILNSYYVRGLINGYAGNYNAAIADFEKFNSLAPNVWAGRNDLAWIYFKLGRYEDAERAARAGLVIKPNSSWLLISHGVSLLNLGKKKEARKDLLAAQIEASKLTPERWGTAYPGNSSDYYSKGLASMRKAIEDNLKLTE